MKNNYPFKSIRFLHHYLGKGEDLALPLEILKMAAEILKTLNKGGERKIVSYGVYMVLEGETGRLLVGHRRNERTGLSKAEEKLLRAVLEEHFKQVYQSEESAG